LRGDEHVLDVATGSGHVALAVARQLPRGRVTGIDFSQSMLEQASAKAAAHDIANIEFFERDMEAPGFSAGLFDAAACGFGIFFVEDMEAQLTRIAETVKPEGKIAITSFAEDYFQPQSGMMLKRLEAFGIQTPPQTWKRIASEENCRQLFETAGLGDIRVKSENMGYFLESEEEWWEIVWSAGFRRLVNQLPQDKLDQFKREHLEEIATLKTDEGIWLDVGVLFTLGIKES
jgi:ubiquinone/menaquinone biosynthesis C-methylase UbiE